MITTKKLFGSLVIMILSMTQPAYCQLKDVLRLKVSSGSYSDETIIRFLEEATDSFDPDWDAYKLKNSGNTPNLYSVMGQEDYVINALHAPFNEHAIDLHLEVAFTGTYTISSEILGAFDSSCVIRLYDKQLDSTVIVETDKPYSFHMSVSDSASRFVISFSHQQTPKLILSDQSRTKATPVKYHSSDGNLYLILDEVQKSVHVRIFAPAGRELVNKDVPVSNGIAEVQVNRTGIFMMELIIEGYSYTSWVTIMNN